MEDEDGGGETEMRSDRHWTTSKLLVTLPHIRPPTHYRCVIGRHAPHAPSNLSLGEGHREEGGVQPGPRTQVQDLEGVLRGGGDLQRSSRISEGAQSGGCCVGSANGNSGMGRRLAEMDGVVKLGPAWSPGG